MVQIMALANGEVEGDEEFEVENILDWVRTQIRHLVNKWFSVHQLLKILRFLV